MRSSIAPAIAPVMLGRISQYIRGAGLRSSRRYPHTAPSDPGQTAAVLVALAIIGGTPSQISVGKLMSDPPKAIALMALATKPTMKTIMLWVIFVTWRARLVRRAKSAQSFQNRAARFLRPERSTDVARGLAGV